MDIRLKKAIYPLALSVALLSLFCFPILYLLNLPSARESDVGLESSIYLFAWSFLLASLPVIIIASVISLIRASRAMKNFQDSRSQMLLAVIGLIDYLIFMAVAYIIWFMVRPLIG